MYFCYVYKQHVIDCIPGIYIFYDPEDPKEKKGGGKLEDATIHNETVFWVANSRYIIGIAIATCQPIDQIIGRFFRILVTILCRPM